MASLALILGSLLAGSAPGVPLGASEAGPPAREAWSYRAAPGWRIFFQGVADRNGNLYWAECTGQWVCDIVSSSSDGGIRFRAPLRNVRPRGRFERGRLIIVGDLVIEAIEQGMVRALRSSDGGEVWSRALGADLCQTAPSRASSSLEIHSITAGRHGDLFLKAHGDPCGTGTRGHWVASLWTSSGVVRWSRAFDRTPSELVTDERGDLFFRVELAAEGPWHRSYLLSLSSQGEEQWRREASWSSLPVVAAKGWLIDAERKVWRTSTGSIAFQMPLEAAWGGQRNALTLVDQSSAFVVASPKGQCPGRDCSLELHRVDLTTGRFAWSVILTQGDQLSNTQPLLTSERTVLFAQSADSGALLREFSSGGEQIRSEVLPPGRYVGAALVANRWVAAVESPAPQIRAFDVEPRLASWVTWCGDRGCGGRPQEDRTVAARRRPRN